MANFLRSSIIVFMGLTVMAAGVAVVYGSSGRHCGIGDGAVTN